MNPAVSLSCSLEDYSPGVDRYDECKTGQGQIRGCWGKLANHLAALDAGALDERAARIEELLQENGAMFNIESEVGRQARPWQLGVLPLVIDADAWGRLETGLRQRTRLLEAVLADLLGPRRLIRERIVPAELLWANPHFHRVYHGLPSTRGIRIHISATDVARAADGSWWVAADRTRAPSGLGYLLENRIITSRVYPHLIRGCNVQRLAGFFDAIRGHLRSLATRSRENPRVVLLTPGTDSNRGFEDAYLARYLGLTLVQGRDLAVRGERLNVKTLGGLLPIEVLWRHLSDRKCDPLELAPDSDEGVTGLVRSIRQGQVAVANAIGSVVAQMPALMPFLAGASEFLLGEPLLLPNIATYWCGGERERRFVLERLDELVIRPAFAPSGTPPTVPAELSSSGREELVAAIRAAPQRYVAQPRVMHSTAPVWRDGRWQPWHVSLRAYQLQTRDGVEVLPGGLVRANPVEPVGGSSPNAGQLTLDCWVRAAGPVDTETTLLPPPDAKITIRRSGDELPSRVAEHLFWLGRYAERCEGIARLLRTTLIRLAGEEDWSTLPEVPRLIAALASLGQIEPDYAIDELGGAMPKLERVLPESVFDAGRPRGLQASIRAMMTNALAVRDRISLDAYRIVRNVSGELGGERSEPADEPDAGRVLERLDRLITDLLAFAGLSGESMTRTHGWRFLELGRRIERADQTAEILNAVFASPVKDERRLCEALLGATDSLMTYRSRYLALVRAEPAIDLLVTDETNPRSIRYQLDAIHDLLGTLPSVPHEVGLGPDEKIAEALLYRLKLSDPDRLGQVDHRGLRLRLDELLQRMIDELPTLSDAIAARYLLHAATTQDLTGVIGGASSAEQSGPGERG